MATAFAPRVFKNFINGEWVESRSGKAHRKPQSGEHRRAGRDVSRRRTRKTSQLAVAAARAAYDKWRLTPAPKRAEILFRAAEILVERKEDFARDMTREMGKVLDETRGDVQEAIDMTYLMAGEGRRQFGQTTPSELPNKFAMSVRAPDRRRRTDHAVEFSDGHSVVENHARAGLRQYGRAEAGGRYAAFDLQPDASARGSRAAAGRAECRIW